MPKVILDAGHGGSDVGEYYEKRSEKNDNLRLALQVGQILLKMGIDVGYTRTSDIYLSMKERVAIANQLGGDLFVSIHRLSGANYSNTPGLDFFVGEDDPVAELAANNIGQELKRSGYQNYGIITRTDIPVINDVDMPALMAGIGYIRTEQENLNFDERFSDIAEAISVGIYETLIPSAEQNNINAQDYIRKASYHYRVGIGAYRSYEEAVDHQYLINRMGFETEMRKWKERYYLYIGEFDSLDEAVCIELFLKRLGYCTFVIRY